MMDERRWRIFKTVADERSFSRAARLMHMSQPAISLQVQAIEDHFGARLFDRDTKAVRLTAAGEALLPIAQRVLELYDQAQRAVSDQVGVVAGQLSIASSLTVGEYVLPAVIGAFRRFYPRVDIRLHIDNTEHVQRMTLEHGVDLGLAEAAVDHRDLHVEPFLSDELVLIVPPDHPWARRAAIAPSELQQAPLIMREAGSGTRRVAEEHLRQAGIDLARLQLVAALGSTEAVKGAVEVGLGVAIMSRWAIRKELRLGTLAAVRLRDFPIQREFVILRHSGRVLSRPAEEFLRLLRATDLNPEAPPPGPDAGADA